MQSRHPLRPAAGWLSALPLTAWPARAKARGTADRPGRLPGPLPRGRRRWPASLAGPLGPPMSIGAAAPRHSRLQKRGGSMSC